MDIRLFAIKVNKDQAEKIAQAKGGLLWRTVFSRNKLSEISQHYIEFKLITYKAIFRTNFIQRLIFRKIKDRNQTITMLANGSTGTAAWVDSMPEIDTLKAVDEKSVQLSDKDDEYLIRKGRKVALRVMHRFIGGIPELEVLRIESVFRPYWVAYYGEMIEGNKVRYIPIPADGCGSHRSF